MSFTPYDWNQSIQTRSEYIEERLRDGSPVIGLSIPDGVLLLSVHRAPRKIYEIYDRLIFGGIGNQSDVETMRSAALDFAHREGFQRSPDDVTAHRLIGSVLSPALKKAFGDPFTAPFVFRGLFAELGASPEEDRFYALGFDGEFRTESSYSVVGGTYEAENQAIDRLHSSVGEAKSRDEAIALGLEAWGTARRAANRQSFGDSGEPADEKPVSDILREALAEGKLEVGLLERNTHRESKFRLLRESELAEVKARYSGG